MCNEIWKSVEGYQGLYQVSTFGRVRSLDRSNDFSVTYPSGKVVIKHKFFPGRVLKACMDSEGYYHVKLCKNSKNSIIKVHRLVYETFIGKIPKKMTIDHINFNKTDNRVDNLRILTRKQNLQIYRDIFKINHRYVDSYGQEFSSFKHYCKRNKILFNRYYFKKSVKLGIPYMKTNLSFKEI